jgi:hypothetical protein
MKLVETEANQTLPSIITDVDGDEDDESDAGYGEDDDDESLKLLSSIDGDDGGNETGLANIPDLLADAVGKMMALTEKVSIDLNRMMLY